MNAGTFMGTGESCNPVDAGEQGIAVGNFGVVDVRMFTLTLCVVGMIGPCVLWVFNRVLARPVPGLMQVAQGSALMVAAGISLSLNGWAEPAVATYCGCLLLMAAGAYWYEGFRLLTGLGETCARTRKVVALYSAGLGALVFGFGNSSLAMSYNAAACALILLACADLGMGAKDQRGIKKVVLRLIGTGSVLLVFLATEFAMSVQLSPARGETIIFVTGLSLFLVLQAAMVAIAVLASERVQGILEREATTDHLTGALVRRELMRRGDIERSRCLREQVPISLLMLDIDHFKRINDDFGHPVGDQVITDLAQKISDVVRPYDVVSRYGGEEFVVVLPGASESVAMGISERIRSIVERGTDGIPMYTVSVGVYCGNVGGLHSMIRQADKALYEAKESGRNKVCLCDYRRKKPSPVSVVPTAKLVEAA